MAKPDKREKKVVTWVKVCHLDEEIGQYVPHKVRADKLNRFLEHHPDDIMMPAEGVCPIIADDVDDLPEVDMGDDEVV
jgi:hypothetical protein